MATVPIEKLGLLKISEANIYVVPAGKVAKVTLISFVNIVSESYTITLSKILDGAAKALRFSIALNPGEFVEDDTTYILKAGDALSAVSDVATVNYIINGEESDV